MGLAVATETPACPRGHTGGRVVRDGIQSKGGRKRQRWRCIASDGSYHRFLGILSRTRANDEACQECENHIAPHEGPATPADFEYLLREIAAALVDVGRGQTYTDAAKRVRARANIGKVTGQRELKNGQTVSEWLPDFVPVVAARHEETEWPAVIVLDSITFYWTNPLTRKSMALYSILAAFGYDKGGSHGRLCRVEASPTADGAAWAEFLDLLPGKPLSIVCDQDTAITAGIDSRWGQWAAVNLVHHCEHHIDAQAKSQFQSDQIDLKDPARVLFRGALKSTDRWAEFATEVRNRPELKLTNRWVEKNAILLQGQIQGRSRIPPVYSNSRVEQVLREFKADLRPRSFAFRNRERLNHLLTLMRLATLRADNPADYATDIRKYLEAAGGHSQRTYRQTYDPRTEEQYSSLWALPAQAAMKEVRRIRALAKLQDSGASGPVD